jgi:hypothetical protein
MTARGRPRRCAPEAAEHMLARARAEVGVVSMVGRGLGKGVILGFAAAVTLAAAAAGTWAWTARTRAGDVATDEARSGVEPTAPAPVVVHDEAEVDDAVEPRHGRRRPSSPRATRSRSAPCPA